MCVNALRAALPSRADGTCLDQESRACAPNGVRVMQQLFVVRATYASPVAVELGLERAAGRFATPTLQYATRAAYVRHLADVFEAQVIRAIGAEGLNRRGPAGSCRPFLGPGFRLGACRNRLVETVKTRKK